MRILLASSSPRRRQLLAQLGLRFDIVAPDIDETRLPDEDLVDYARRLSMRKAAAARKLDKSALIIAADTIVEFQGELLGKPADAAEAGDMLRRLRARSHSVITAFTLRRATDMPRAFTRHVRTIVTMRDYSDAEIAAYIATGDPFDKAGGYAIQNQAFHPVARIDGSYSNVVGLPLKALAQALREFGLAIPPETKPAAAPTSH